MSSCSSFRHTWNARTRSDPHKTECTQSDSKFYCFIVQMKTIRQDICKADYHWDTELDSELKIQLMKLISELEEVNVIRIPRCVTSEANTKEFVYELEGFSDASSSAYAAVMYLVIKSQNSIQVLLIASKTRLAPLNKLIIPRLEFLAALILARGVARIFQRGVTLCQTLSSWRFRHGIL